MPNGKRGAPSKLKVIRHAWVPVTPAVTVSSNVILLAHIFEGVVLLAEMYDQSLCA